MTRTELVLWLLWLRLQGDLWELPDDPFDPSEWMS